MESSQAGLTQGRPSPHPATTQLFTLTLFCPGLLTSQCIFRSWRTRRQRSLRRRRSSPGQIARARRRPAPSLNRRAWTRARTPRRCALSALVPASSSDPARAHLPAALQGRAGASPCLWPSSAEPAVAGRQESKPEAESKPHARKVRRVCMPAPFLLLRGGMLTVDAAPCRLDAHQDVTGINLCMLGPQECAQHVGQAAREQACCTTRHEVYEISFCPACQRVSLGSMQACCCAAQ